MPSGELLGKRRGEGRGKRTSWPGNRPTLLLCVGSESATRWGKRNKNTVYHPIYWRCDPCGFPGDRKLHNDKWGKRREKERLLPLFDAVSDGFLRYRRPSRLRHFMS